MKTLDFEIDVFNPDDIPYKGSTITIQNETFTKKYEVQSLELVKKNKRKRDNKTTVIMRCTEIDT